MDEMTRNMNGLLELNRQMIQDILQLRMSQVHGRENPIVVDDSSEGDILDTAPVLVPELVVHTLVPILELTESREGSEEEEGDVSAQFYDLFKTFIPLIQPSLYSNSHTHDFMIYKSHDTRTSRQ